MLGLDVGYYRWSASRFHVSVFSFSLLLRKSDHSVKCFRGCSILLNAHLLSEFMISRKDEEDLQESTFHLFTFFLKRTFSSLSLFLPQFYCKHDLQILMKLSWNSFEMSIFKNIQVVLINCFLFPNSSMFLYLLPTSIASRSSEHYFLF